MVYIGVDIVGKVIWIIYYGVIFRIIIGYGDGKVVGS